MPASVQDPTMMDAVAAGVDDANREGETEEEKKARQTEENEVKELWEEYEAAREFDKEARSQFAVDRRYAAGTANLDWAVTANLIGAFIDILVSFLFARNPDVSVKKTPRVENTGTKDEDYFAKTMQIIVSSLLTAPITRFKTLCRAQVRSTLTVGQGWIKAIVQCAGTNIPQMQTELNDSRNNIAQLEELKQRYGALTVDPETGEATPYAPEEGEKSEEEVDAELLKLRELEQSLSNRLEIAIRKNLVVDHVRAEDIQVSLDVSDISDYANAGWIANAIYRRLDKAKGMFPRLTAADWKQARHYFQRKTKDLQPLADRVRGTGIAGVEVNADEAETYITDSSKAGPSDNAVCFVKIVELWNRETGHVHTMVDGVKRWAKEPYQPDYPSSRFYPYFGLFFYLVDGSRHPQSLSWRLMKLQDEYAEMRSSQRQVRRRAKPGIIFNKTGLSPEDAERIQNSTEQEMVGVAPTNPDTPISQLFAPKPVEVADPRLYDAQMILSDMERISGVQEALAQTSQVEKTATQSEIEQTGFASRTTSDRDTLETMLTELANYIGEIALTALTMQDAARMAGAKAFWPQGMAVDDILSMVEIKIEAGTTGKPKTAGDKEAWGVVMPLIKETLLQIIQAQLAGNTAVVESLTAILQETLVRMGDETDVSRFLPTMPPAPIAGPAVPGAMPGGPPTAGPEAGGAPPADGAPPEDGSAAAELLPPELLNPELSAPTVPAPV